MDAISLVLALAGTLDLCISKGKEIKQFCHEIRNLTKDIGEMSLTLQGICAKIELQIGLIRSLWKTPGLLHPTLQTHYASAISNLEKRLLGALTTLERTRAEKLSSNKISIKLKTVYLTKDLKEVIADLELWQQRFDPSWYLITLLTPVAIDNQLQVQGDGVSTKRLSEIRKALSDVSNQGKSLNGSIFKPIQSVSNQHDQIQGTNIYESRYNEKQVLLDRTNYEENTNRITAKEHVRDMARMLSHVDPGSFGLLQCIGVVEIQPEAPIQSVQFEYILEIPDGLKRPRTLREFISTTPNVSLTRRLKLAKQLTRSVMFVHTMGFVHKGIRPETVIIFEDDNNLNNEHASIGPSFLTGFECVRYEKGQTEKMGDLEWQRNLYRHPNRQGIWPEDSFKMQHDIYSLGVCLLEIALWRSFISYSPDTHKPLPWSGLMIENTISDHNSREHGKRTKEKLEAIVNDKLDFLVGETYTEVVLKCLRCLDSGNGRNVFERSKVSLKIEDEDGLVVGVRFIENVLLKMEELSI